MKNRCGQGGRQAGDRRVGSGDREREGYVYGYSSNEFMLCSRLFRFFLRLLVSSLFQYSLCSVEGPAMVSAELHSQFGLLTHAGKQTNKQTKKETEQQPTQAN